MKNCSLAQQMKIRITAYGIAREIAGNSAELVIADNTVRELRKSLLTAYPRLSALTSLMVAVNGQYASDDTLIQPYDEVVIIPPVSGG